jgi:hypothetical protein
VLAVGESHGEGGLGVRMAGADLVLALGDAEREEVGLDGGGAFELPAGVGERLDKLGFGGLFGPIFVEEGLGVALVGSVILGGKDDGLAC